jgi:hypothetical protein
MQFEIEVPYIMPLRAVLYALWNKSKGTFLFLAIYISFTLFAFPVSCISNTSLYRIQFSAVLLLIGMSSASYFHLLKHTKRLSKKIASKPMVHFTFSNESTRIISSIVLWEIHLQWKGYNQLKKLSGLWIVYLNPTTCFAIPTNLLTVEQQEFILAKLKENHVKIR